jgi:hypothetical protein
MRPRSDAPQAPSSARDTPRNMHSPGDLDGEILPQPSLTPEIEMPRNPARSTPAAGRPAASSAPDESDPICLRGDPISIAQSARAVQAGNWGGRRGLVDPTTYDRDFGAAELELMQAMKDYKRRSGRMFPTWSEVLEVLTGLGYEKATAGPGMHGVRPATSRGATP